MSINMKVGIGFSIINLTEFEWHELQGNAQRIADALVWHTAPTGFELSDAALTHYNGAVLVVWVRRLDNALEFMFVQTSELVAMQQPPLTDAGGEKE